MTDLTTDAQRTALDALRGAAGEGDGALERHSLRVFEIATWLAPEGDREVMLVAAILHDVGVFETAGGPGPYVTDGRNYAQELLAPFGWDERRLNVCLDSIEFHHELRNQSARGTEVEAIRKADLVDVTGGLVSFGIDKARFKELRARIPVGGFYGALAKIALPLARRKPWRIFRPQ